MPRKDNSHRLSSQQTNNYKYLTPYPETESRTNMFLKLPVWNTTQEELIIILPLKIKEYARSGNLEYSLGWEENVTDTPTIYMT